MANAHVLELAAASTDIGTARDVAAACGGVLFVLFGLHALYVGPE